MFAQGHKTKAGMRKTLLFITITIYKTFKIIIIVLIVVMLTIVPLFIAVEDGGGSWTWSFHGCHFSLWRDGRGELFKMVWWLYHTTIMVGYGLLLKHSWNGYVRFLSFSLVCFDFEPWPLLWDVMTTWLSRGKSPYSNGHWESWF